MNIAAQIIGFIALTFMYLSYQKNNKKDFEQAYAFLFSCNLCISNLTYSLA